MQQWKGDPISGKPIEIDLKFFMKRPKNHYGTGRNAGKLKPNAPVLHSKKPDIDNLIKFVFDCLNGQVWKDDALIYYVSALKMYAETPRTEITI